MTGDVTARALATPSAHGGLAIYDVSFTPGARTHWHAHPLGQLLYITSGVARVVLDGQPPRDLVAGETAWIPPATRHWHGAAPGASAAHLAIQRAASDGTTAVWAEPVTDPS